MLVDFIRMLYLTLYLPLSLSLPPSLYVYRLHTNAIITIIIASNSYIIYEF